MKSRQLRPNPNRGGRPLLASLTSLVHQRGIWELSRKAYQLWRREGWSGIYQRLAMLGHSYRLWVRLFDTLHKADRNAILSHISIFEHRPFISILIPVFNSSEPALRAAIESVRTQLYPCWELHFVDASAESNIHAALQEYERLDDRIKTIPLSSKHHASAFRNGALEAVNGEFFALMSHDSILAEHALYMVAAVVNKNPELTLIYSDEDKIDTRGLRSDPYFKPEWNPLLAACQNMVSHLSVYRTKVVRSLGGGHFDGTQDWDLALRVAENIQEQNICHIPHVLYHSRTHSESTTPSTDAESYAVPAGKRAVVEHLARRGIKAEVLSHPELEGQLRIRYQLPDRQPLVSIIVPTRNGLDLLKRCLDSLRALTTYRNYEIIVIDNQSDDPQTLSFLSQRAAQGELSIHEYNAPFNYSAINNSAVQASKGEILCFLNNDVEIIDPDWLSELVAHAVQPGAGAVGARLLFPDGNIQHAGVMVGIGGVAAHIYAGYPVSEPGSGGRALLQQNMTAVTGACLVVTRAAFESVDGFDAEHLPVAFNDIDLCLKLTQAGFRNAWTPFSTLVHYESASRGKDNTPEKRLRFLKEAAYMQLRWGELLPNDPAYNRNLTLDCLYPFPSFPPRSEKPWKSLAR